LVAATFLLLSGPLSAHAYLVWDWTGDCDGVIGPLPPVRGGSNGWTGQATFHAVQTDAYIRKPVPPPAQTIDQVREDLASLLEARYTDENVTFDFLGDGGLFWMLNAFGFRLPAVPGDPFGNVSMEAHVFRTGNTGWRFGSESLRPGCHVEDDPICGYGASGSNGVWTRVAVHESTFVPEFATLVPEPATLVLLPAGLASLRFLRRRKVS